MEFKETKAIYLQIAERICNEILLGKYPEEGRIPSVREYAAEVEVNVNTLMRSFDYLQQKDIIYNKRGIGYFVAKGAKKLIYKELERRFLEEDLSDFFDQLQLLNIPIEKVVSLYEDYKTQQTKKEQS